MVLIDKAALLNKIATEVHYDSEHSLEMYAKMLSLINDAPDGVVRCKDCKWYEIEQIKRDGTDDKRYKPSVCVIGVYAEPRKADWYCADGERREDETD